MNKISEAEIEVLKAIWNRENIADSNTIINDLKNFNWHKNTIRTMISRLRKKGIIEIVNKTSKSYYFRATIDREDFKYFKTKKLLDQLFEGKIENLNLNYKQKINE